MEVVRKKDWPGGGGGGDLRNVRALGRVKEILPTLLSADERGRRDYFADQSDEEKRRE